MGQTEVCENTLHVDSVTLLEFPSLKYIEAQPIRLQYYLGLMNEDIILWSIITINLHGAVRFSKPTPTAATEHWVALCDKQGRHHQANLQIEMQRPGERKIIAQKFYQRMA